MDKVTRLSTNHNLFEEKGEPNALPLGQTGSHPPKWLQRCFMIEQQIEASKDHRHHHTRANYAQRGLAQSLTKEELERRIWMRTNGTSSGGHYIRSWSERNMYIYNYIRIDLRYMVNIK